MQSHTIIYVPGIRISCCCISTHSMCVFNHGYITYRKLSLCQKALRYLLVHPITLLKPLVLDLSNYLTCLPVFQKNWALSCSVTVEENGKQYQLSNLLFFPPLNPFYFSLLTTAVSQGKVFPWLCQKLRKGRSYFSIPVFFPFAT